MIIMQKVIGLVQAVNLNTRKAVNRGYTDLQIEEINNRYMVQNDFFPRSLCKNKSSRTYMFESFYSSIGRATCVMKSFLSLCCGGPSRYL